MIKLFTIYKNYFHLKKVSFNDESKGKTSIFRQKFMNILSPIIKLHGLPFS